MRSGSEPPISRATSLKSVRSTVNKTAQSIQKKVGAGNMTRTTQNKSHSQNLRSNFNQINVRSTVNKTKCIAGTKNCSKGPEESR